ncbi:MULTISPECIES: hypothetical protein [unclassified Bradyrhizobium]|uniref:hypothetical protein n=1 Tax=unclassified Bradyrhizobium TaxID=2631580 RepID=UPI0028EA95BC|nr:MULTISPECIES: hypothetical protein [unclassified Bradyrhizobium]
MIYHKSRASGCPYALRVSRAHEEHTMLDILMLALAAGFFALAIGYTYACERL